ncbi:hypothetical protein Tco_0901565 [Tanacetum coccineum]
MVAFRVLNTEFQQFINSRFSSDSDGEMTSKSRNDVDVDNADIKPIYNEEPMAEVQLTADNNVFATEQQHIEQHEFNNEGGVYEDSEQCHENVLCLLN